MNEKTESTTRPAAESASNGNGNKNASLPVLEVDGKDNRDGRKTDDQTDAHQAEESKADEAPANDKQEAPPSGLRRRLPYIIGGIFILAAIGGAFYWLYSRQYETTDDAFIEGDIVQVSPKVSAYVSKLYFKENQLVHKGDLLLELDGKDYQARLEQARAQLRAAEAQRNQARANVTLTRATTGAGVSQARSNVQTARSNVEQTRLTAAARESAVRQAQTAVKTAEANLAQTRAQLPQAEANLQLAQTEANRYQELFNRGDIPRQRLDQAIAALRTAESQIAAARTQVDAARSRVDEANANVATARDNYRQAVAQINLTQSQVNESTGRLQDANAAPERVAATETQVSTAEAQIAQAEAAVKQAELDLSYTKIYAPEDGYVARKNVEEGQLVQPGAALLALSQKDVWVIANFKETQLERMRVGQEVEIKVDAYPNQKFRGKIESFQAGTGSRFSVLPSENATGNYVKVVQRIPVKIVFDETPDTVHLLAPGMSVQPRVKVK